MSPGSAFLQQVSTPTWMMGSMMWSALALTLMFPLGAAAQSPEDRAGAERAVLDYWEGFYEGSTEKLCRGVRPDVLKLASLCGTESTTGARCPSARCSSARRA